jgi:hypothetical protein
MATIIERLAAIETRYDENGVDDALSKELHEVVFLILLNYNNTEELYYARELYDQNEDDDKIFYQLLFTAQKTIF